MGKGNPMGVWRGPPGSNRRGGIKGMPKTPALLRTMRKVWKTGEGEDGTEGERRCRQMLTQSPEAFTKQMSELEKAHAARMDKWRAERAKKQEKAREEEKAATPTQADEGTLRVIELIERLLGEYESSAGTAAATR